MIEMVILLYSFIIITGIGAWVLQQAHSGLEIFLATLFAPVSFHLATRILQIIGQVFVPTRTDAHALAQTSSLVAGNGATMDDSGSAVSVAQLQPDLGQTKIDLDRRLFLRMIASAGLGVFLMQIFAGKANAAFFGSLPGTSSLTIKNTHGEKIDPAEEHPTDGYEVSEIDDASYPAYYGFVHSSGSWYITREANDGSYRYAKGSSAFSLSWTGRAALIYDYYDTVF